MELLCKKEVIMEEEQTRCFTAGKIYAVNRYNAWDGYVVIDDDGEDHDIGEPGESWFDKHFEEVANGNNDTE